MILNIEFFSDSCRDSCSVPQPKKHALTHYLLNLIHTSILELCLSACIHFISLKNLGSYLFATYKFKCLSGSRFCDSTIVGCISPGMECWLQHGCSRSVRKQHTNWRKLSHRQVITLKMTTKSSLESLWNTMFFFHNYAETIIFYYLK